MTWPLTFYVDELPDGFAGVANGPVIRILKSYRHDRPLYLHEVQHVRQWFMTLGLHSMLYPLVRRYRLWAEATAYAVQANAGDDIDRLAGFMARPVYRLDITADEARREIQRHL